MAAELYDIANDPYEWKNLAADSAYADQLLRLRNLSPKSFAAKPQPSDESLSKLKWIPHRKKAASIQTGWSHV